MLAADSNQVFLGVRSELASDGRGIPPYQGERWERGVFHQIGQVDGAGWVEVFRSQPKSWRYFAYSEKEFIGMGKGRLWKESRMGYTACF